MRALIWTFILGLLTSPLFAAEGPKANVPLATKTITVAFAVTDMANVIDIAGPWEVFQDAISSAAARSRSGGTPFKLIVVSHTKAPVSLTGGMKIVPDFTFADAPQADLVVVGAQHGAPGLTEWLKAHHAKGGRIMSVCTGALTLAETGLLDGRPATTHHLHLEALRKAHPSVKVQPTYRWVQADERIFTAGGLTSGIDLALHMVALYFGDDVAEHTADFLEHMGQGWKNPEGASPPEGQPPRMAR